MTPATEIETKKMPFLGHPSSLRLEEFDAVIEGTVASRHLPQWYELGFHREALYLPPDVGTLIVGRRNIQLYGRTRDFFTINRVTPNARTHHPLALVGAEWPRSIVLKNGNVYVANDVKKDAEYVARLPDIVMAAEAFFHTGNFGN